MGVPMAGRLVDAGHDVTVWNRTPEKAEPVVRRGARQAATPAEAATGAEVAITMVADPTALRSVVGGADGLAAGLGSGSYHLEMSTVGPETVRELPGLLPAGVILVDAPVLGSIPQANEGTLKIFVGGTEDAFEEARPLLETVGSPRRLGELGAGAAMKLVANSTLGALMTGLVWNAGFKGFSWFVKDPSRFSRIHGSIATIIVFMIWVYVSSVILLWGVEFTASYGKFRRDIRAAGAQANA